MDSVIWNLKEIDRLFKELSKDSQTFKNNYPEWVCAREGTITVFSKLRNEMDNISVRSSTTKAVGSGVSILGGLATIAGFALTFSKSEDLRQLGKKMTKNGSLASILGSVGTTSTSLFEAGLNKKKLDEAKLCLEEDEQLTMKLMPWLRNVKNLDDLFQEVFGCSILTDTWLDILAVLKNVMVIKKQGSNVLRDLGKILSSGVKTLYSDAVKGYNKNYSLDLEKISKKVQFLNDKTKFILKGFCNDPNVREAVQEMYNSFKRSPIVFEISKIGLSINLKLWAVSKAEILVILSILPAVDKVAFDVLPATFQSILAAVNVSMDVLAFLSAVDDICKSKSRYSELLEKIEVILNKELTIIRTAYKQLNKYHKSL